jgi:hypothetical protein
MNDICTTLQDMSRALDPESAIQYLQIKLLERYATMSTQELVDLFGINYHDLVACEVGRLVAKKSFQELVALI